jgi:hypothetical protein
MTSVDITCGDQDKWELGEISLKASISANAESLSLIYQYIMVVEGNDWLTHATAEASKEMISDTDIAIKEAKAAIQSARKQIPFHYRYIINPFNSWLQKLK